MKYNDWLNFWLENYIEPNAKMRTTESYRRIIDKRLRQELGKCEMGELTAPTIHGIDHEGQRRNEKRAGFQHGEYDYNGDTKFSENGGAFGIYRKKRCGIRTSAENKIERNRMFHRGGTKEDGKRGSLR